MRPLAIFLLLILACCKGQEESENRIDPSVYAMWDDYMEANPENLSSELPDSWYFHTNQEDANRLANLVVIGKKRASSGLYLWYKEANADLPAIGTKHIITDFDGNAKAIIEIIKVDTVPFNQISAAYAEMDMGTETEPLKKWKKAHYDFFTSALGGNTEKPVEQMLVVCESFEKIWPKSPQ